MDGHAASTDRHSEHREATDSRDGFDYEKPEFAPLAPVSNGFTFSGSSCGCPIANAYLDKFMKRPTSLFFGKDHGMVYFLVFLILVIIIVPMVNLSPISRFALSGIFALTLIFGAFATIRHRLLTGLAVALAVAALAVELIAELAPERGSPELEAALKLACLSILVFMTLKKALRPGCVDAYRVIAGIAGYLLIGFTWTFAYQLVVNRAPGAIHFVAGPSHASAQQPSDLIYYSFITLCTVGYGDAYPVHPIVRSLAVAEALVGQLYLTILIASLVGMALQTKPVVERGLPSQGAATPREWKRREAKVGQR